MAQLKDLIVNGASRLIGDVILNNLKITGALQAPTAAGGSSYGPGTFGQALLSNATGVYWGNITSGVSGVKGNAESTYRTGDVNLTPANIGAATSDHAHTTTIATSTGTSQITLDYNTKYAITAGDTSYIFTTPSIATYVHGTSGYLAKFTTEGSVTAVTNGPQLGTSTTAFLNNKGEWTVPPGTYVHPTTTAVSAAAVKVGQNNLGHVILGSALTASDVGALSTSGGTITGNLTIAKTSTNSTDGNLTVGRNVSVAGAVSVTGTVSAAAIEANGVNVDYEDAFNTFSGETFIDNLDVTTINGVTVGNNPQFTDTIYTLPTASASTLGGVKIGDGITITDGVISAIGIEVVNLIS